MSLERRFDHLSASNEHLRPLTSVDINLSVMRQSLQEAGVNLDLGEAERVSLVEPRFRNLESGRGIGVVAALGQEKAEALLEWCSQRAEGGPRLKKKGNITEGSEGRGLRQLAADIIQLVSDPEPSEETVTRFCLRINQRVKKGLLWEVRGGEPARGKIRQVFGTVPDSESTFSSVPSGAVADLWDFLTLPVLAK